MIYDLRSSVVPGGRRGMRKLLADNASSTEFFIGSGYTILDCAGFSTAVNLT